MDLFERLNCGCVLIDASGHVLRANERARRHIGRELIISYKRLHATRPERDVILQRLITAMLMADPCFEVAPGSLALHREIGRPLVLRVAPPIEPVHLNSSGAKIIVTLIDLDDCPELPQEILQTAFGLTPAEAKIAQRIACGDCLEDIAERYRISVGTVRSQLKSLFQKTQTHRQAELVSLLARLGRLT